MWSATYTNRTSAEEKENLKIEYETHLSEKNLSRIENSYDKNKIDQNYVVACFDLQAVPMSQRRHVNILLYFKA